jgi:hypothetical protein
MDRPTARLSVVVPAPGAQVFRGEAVEPQEPGVVVVQHGQQHVAELVYGGPIAVEICERAILVEVQLRSSAAAAHDHAPWHRLIGASARKQQQLRRRQRKLPVQSGDGASRVGDPLLQDERVARGIGVDARDPQHGAGHNDAIHLEAAESDDAGPVLGRRADAVDRALPTWCERLPRHRHLNARRQIEAYFDVALRRRGVAPPQPQRRRRCQVASPALRKTAEPGTRGCREIDLIGDAARRFVACERDARRLDLQRVSVWPGGTRVAQEALRLRGGRGQACGQRAREAGLHLKGRKRRRDRDLVLIDRAGARRDAPRESGEGDERSPIG